MKRFTLSCAVAALAAILLPLGVKAKTTAVPGGANQAAGVQVTYPAPVFNGFVRIKPKYFGPPRSGKDNIVETPADRRQILVFEGVISNGRTTPYMDDPSILRAGSSRVHVPKHEMQAYPHKIQTLGA